MWSAFHEEAVEMERGVLILERVEDFDNDTVSDVGLDGRDGPLPIDADGLAVKQAVGICCDPGDVEVIVDRGSTDPG